ncbi:MAG TPA: pilus assembly protein PilM [Nitrospiraceae bacterium]|nr:pilus assembly protein PilM [Nitrospiraceae bacterium]
MIAECVGLDIGQTAFKAVRFRRRLTGRESVEYFHQPVPYGRQEHTEPAQRTAMLRNFLWQHGLYGSGEIVTALPCQDVFVRTLSFPFRDASKLAQVVPFEMENLIPMPLEDVTVGSLVLPARESQEGTEKSKGSDVLVTAAPKVKIAEHLRFMASADLNPSAITVDGMALFSVSQFLKEEGAQVPGDMAIIDVGASKTTLCLVHEGRPVLLRTVLWGGNHLTHALAVRYACSFAEAERRKRAMAVQEIDAWLEPVLKELRVSLQAYEGSVHQRLTHCWVSGGGSKLKELSGHMAHQLGLAPVGPRQGFGSNCPRAFSIAFGLAIHPNIVRPRWKSRLAGSNLALDFKAGIDASSATTDISKQDRRLALWGGLILAILALADISVRVVLKDSTVKDLKRGLQAQYEQTFGPGAGPGEELDQARYRVSQLEKSLSLVDGTGSNVLMGLAELVKHVPSGIPLKVRDLTIDGNSIHLEGETTTFDAVEKIKQAFAADETLHDVSVSDTRVGAMQNQVVFRLTYTVQRP